MNNTISRSIIAILVCISSLGISAQTSISIEHIFNTAYEKYSPTFLDKIGGNMIGVQSKVTDDLYFKGQIGGKKIAIYSITNPAEIDDVWQLIYTLAARYDVMPLILGSESRLRVMPLISYQGGYQNKKDFQFPEKNFTHQFAGGAGIDIRILKRLGVTSSYSYRLFSSQYALPKAYFQLGINYTF